MSILTVESLKIDELPPSLVFNIDGTWYDHHQIIVDIPFHRVAANDVRVLVENELDFDIVKEWIDRQSLNLYIDYEPVYFEEMDTNMYNDDLPTDLIHHE